MHTKTDIKLAINPYNHQVNYKARQSWSSLSSSNCEYILHAGGRPFFSIHLSARDLSLPTHRFTGSGIYCVQLAPSSCLDKFYSTNDITLQVTSSTCSVVYMLSTVIPPTWATLSETQPPLYRDSSECRHHYLPTSLVPRFHLPTTVATHNNPQTSPTTPSWCVYRTEPLA